MKLSSAKVKDLSKLCSAKVKTDKLCAAKVKYPEGAVLSVTVPRTQTK